MTELPPTAARLPRASRLARRFDRLRVKLFLAIAGTNAVVAAVAYLLFSLSFDRGLMEYVHRNDLARLDTLVAALASDYRREGGWQTAVEDREAWMERVRDALGLPQRDGERQSGKAAAGDQHVCADGIRSGHGVANSSPEFLVNCTAA